MTNLWAYGWVPGENPGQQFGFGLPRGHYAVDQVTFVLAQGHYLVNLNQVPFMGGQDHYQLEQVYPDPPPQHHLGEPVRPVWQQGR